MFNEFIHEVNVNSQPLSADEERDLYNRHKAGDADAGHTLVKRHYKLALVLGLQHVKRGGKLEELFQEGVLGLYKALDRFDPDKGARFASYATWWVNSHIQDHMRDMGRQVSLPSHIVDQLAKLSVTTETFVAEEHRDPTDEELSNLLSLSERQISKLREQMVYPLSLDGEFDAEGSAGNKLRDIIEDVHQETAREYSARLSDISYVKTLMDRRLTDQERSVLCHRFGLCGEQETTLVETGKKVGISTARVQQIEQAALGKLKKAMAST